MPINKTRALLLASLFVYAGVAVAAQDPEITVRPPPTGWATQSSVPFSLDIRSRRGGEFRITTVNDGRVEHTVRRTVTVPPNSSARIEMTLPNHTYARVMIDGSGAQLSQTFAMPSFSNYYLNGRYPPPLVFVNNYLMREFRALDEAEKKADTEIAVINLDELPGRWQSYSGFVGVLVMDPGEVRALRPAQREAMLLWVKWLGGRLWLAGEGAEAAARDIGFTLKGKPDQRQGGVGRHRQLNGVLFIQSRADAGELARHAPEGPVINPLTTYYNEEGSYYYSTSGRWLLNSFGGVSTNAIVAVLLLLGLALGPLNFWYIRRRKNTLLFFLTTPVIAMAGTMGILGASLWSEGLGGSYRQCAILVRGDGEEAMLYDGRGVRSGFFASTPHFSSQSLVLPMHDYEQRLDLATDVTDGVLLAGGWLTPRSTSGYLAVQPVVGRMNLEIVEEADGHYAVNELGYRVVRMAALLPDGKYGWAENIPPGGRARLNPTGNIDRLEVLYQEMKRLFGDTPAFAGVTLVASCEGLPYIDDAGLNASRREAEFYYCRAGQGGGEVQP